MTSVAEGPGGKLAAIGSSDGRAILWDLSGNSVKKELKGHTGAVRSVAFDGTGVKIATGSSDGSARLWDSSGVAGKVLKGCYACYVQRLAYSPLGKALVILVGNQYKGGGGYLDLFDLAANKKIRTLTPGKPGLPSRLAIRPDGAVIAVKMGSYGTLLNSCK